ncbi:MAG: cobalt-precorrin-5B (C(1))-methyltransferase [Desulforhopalus sp.]|nr:cobalt-precorrin-5B (C(1))-methyltransferase [Desulforhopalus sp.]
MAKETKNLRSGFTTGANCAAATKAALTAIITGKCPTTVEIPFPGGKRHRFTLTGCTLDKATQTATTSLIKDAGDDPDVTHLAEIRVTVSLKHNPDITPPHCLYLDNIQLCSGRGVGHATKPGLACKPGEPAINPGPRQMIKMAVKEIPEVTGKDICVTLSIPKGEELAKETLNGRLGIVGGLSILGTTGIVRPLSAAAWRATVAASLKMAKESGLREVVVSTGRTSEKAARQYLHLPEAACIEMGDFLKFTLKAAGHFKFDAVHYSGMWAKVTKAALRVPQTHVRNGALEMTQAAALLEELGARGELLHTLQGSNTAREMFYHLIEAGRDDIVEAVCRRAKNYCEELSGLPVPFYLVDPDGNILVKV